MHANESFAKSIEVGGASPLKSLRESDFLAIRQSFPKGTPVRGSVGDRIIHGGDVYIARAATGVPRRGLCTLGHRRSIIDGTKS
jgi:hypothetical protein